MALTQRVGAGLSNVLRQRLATLGIAAAWFDAGGRAALEVCGRPLERWVAEFPLLAAEVRRRWRNLGGPEGRPVEAWPGLWLVPLPVERRRRGRRPEQEERLLLALLLTPRLLESEQFQRLCDIHLADREATMAAVDPASLVGDGDVARIAAMLAWMQEDTRAVERGRNELQTLSQQLADSYEELSLLYKLSAHMLVNQSPLRFLADACQQLLAVVRLRWLVLQLVEADMPLDELAGQMISAGSPVAEPAVMRRIGQQLMQLQGGSARALVFDDTRKLRIEPLERLGTSLLVVPLTRGDRSYGILYGGDKLDGSRISSVDSKLCRSLASILSIFLENAMLYEDAQAMFVGTLHALTSSIDAKDSYTYGHSERVALVSRMLAQAAGLEAPQVDRVYLSGLIHDVGKIGVPETVLCKPGRLTVAEYDLVKQHPVIGARILQDIRQMHDLIPGVLYHHERWDGRGYPEGLAGAEIPRLGRVIGLADAFDAMSSNRTYRGAMERDEVRQEIRRCTGSQFDPQLARLFIDLDFTPFFDLILIHQKQHQLMQRSA